MDIKIYREINGLHIRLSEKEKYDLINKYHSLIEEEAKAINVKPKDFHNYIVKDSSLLNSEILEIRNTLISCYYKFILKNANKINNSQLSKEDIVQNSIFGIIEGLSKINLSKIKNYKVSVYLMQWIKAYANREIINQNSLVKLPTWQLNTLNQIKRINEDNLTPSKIAQKIGMSEKKVKKILSNQTSFVHLKNTSGTQSVLINNEAIKNDNFYSDTEFKEELEIIFNQLDSILTPTEKYVVLEYIGYYDGNKKTLSYIGEKIGYSIMRTQMINKRAIKKLQKEFNWMLN